jgi:hypothetical protein
MKSLGRIWLIVFGVSGAITILARDVIAGMLQLSPQSGPWILTVGGVGLIALAIAPRFMFRRR